MASENRTSSPKPEAIGEAERLIILAEHIRRRLKQDGDDVYVLGMTGLALDIQAARCALDNIAKVTNLPQPTHKEERDHECG